MIWQVHEAKQRFSELVRRALAEGPQVVTRHGKQIVVVVAVDEFQRLTSGHEDVKHFLLAGPDLDALELQRSTQTAREVEF